MFKITDIKFFKTLLQSFSTKKHISFNITPQTFQLYSIDRSILYINLATSLFHTTITSSNFTLNPQILHKYLPLFTNTTIFTINTSFNIENNHNNIISNITIPFIEHIHFEPQELLNIHTKFFVTNIRPLTYLKGIINYRIEDNMLRIRQNTQEIADEIVMYNIEVITNVNLNFSCWNDWSGVLECVDGYVEKVRFLFGHNVLFVQVLVKDYNESFIELTIPRTLV